MMRSPNALRPKLHHSEAHSQEQCHDDSRPPRHQFDFKCDQGKEDSIAVVGMSIKVAGADDLDEFSQMLKKGESQHELIGPDRLMFDTLFRERDKDQLRKWYGNFVRDVDAFDHKFFKRSPRESATMDPQQRLYLQAAYQAVEQSGYFTETVTGCGGEDKQQVGVYLGACSGDYEHHIACHTANAFTATGNLKSFIAGKVSHYFGWTGPSMTFDTACSASAVAIHTACRNLLSSECTAALAGGVATMTNFLWFQNLAGASFLSSTGQCKPFDEKADGYCRAEGIACVFLKRVSDAIADGNPILGRIASTAVYQNQNYTPLFVPNSPSLSQLFRDIIKKAKLTPRDISLVEAHGTGTPVGDPVEYESIRMTLGGPIRCKPLYLGSVKGHIGHTEGASGVISLIKVIMMIHESFIPPQASFSKISSHINVEPSDQMEVVTSLRTWDTEHKVALINNYGASGSNASMVVTQPPCSSSDSFTSTHIHSYTSTEHFPFWITGLDARSIDAYNAKLAPYLQSRPHITLADASFNMSRQSNRSLPCGLIFSCRSTAELNEKLSQATCRSSSRELRPAAVKPERPVILCFGGQVSLFVGLDRKLYDSVSLLRYHLNKCDTMIQSLGLKSLYPEIFSRTPMQNTVQLQIALFAMQYACAKCWMDSGLSEKVAAVVGHSFGEITALCISGVLSLKDTISLVAGRAHAVRDLWGSDPGAMMAVEADEVLVHDLLAEANNAYGGDNPAGIACYNGPVSFTLAGSVKALEAVAGTILRNKKFSVIKSKRLKVTNAFHSTLVEPLLERLEQIGKNFNFSDAVIPFERATETKLTNALTPKFVPDQMRKPVFFNNAIHRTIKDHPSAIFLEAGSSSTITVMAARALAGKASSESYHFQALNITGEKGLDGLTDTTVSLWKQGLRVSFWAHHALQTPEYHTLLLPPYQFEKSRHWLELKSPVEAVTEAASQVKNKKDVALQPQEKDEKNLGLWTFFGYQDEGRKNSKGESKSKYPRFRINTGSDQYNVFISGHVIAKTAPICPATLVLDMAIEALFSLHPNWKAQSLQPVLHDMVNYTPICVNPSRSVWLDFEALEDCNLWKWKVLSVSGAENRDPQTHVEGRLHIRSPTEVTYRTEFARFERLVSHSKCDELLQLNLDDRDVGILQGRNMYSSFSEVVDYSELYRGVRAVIGSSGECVGLVHKQHSGETWLDVPLSDSFSQVGGIWVNCMIDPSSNDMYIATGCEMSMRSPFRALKAGETGPSIWHVFARHTRQSQKMYMTDVFVFDARNGLLTEVTLGIQYSKVGMASMSKILTRLTADESVLKNRATSDLQGTTSAAKKAEGQTDSASPASLQQEVSAAKSREMSGKKTKLSRGSDITNDVKNLIANVSGIEAGEIKLDSEMVNLGIDSLMGMEIAREIEIVFKCKLDEAELMEAASFRDLVTCISRALSNSRQDSTAATDADSEGDREDCSSNVSVEGGDAWSKNDHVDSATSSDPDTEISILKSQPIVTEETEASLTTTMKSTGLSMSNLTLLQSDILECFGEMKMLSDEHIHEYHLDNIEHSIIAASNRLCVVLIVEAFEELGCPLHNIAAGDTIERVPFQALHRRLMEFVYSFLEKDARLIDIDVLSGQLTRTSIAAPHKTSEMILQELLDTYPEFIVANKLTYYAGKHLAAVLSGKTDGIHVIFGSTEGRELVQALYCEHTFNRMNYHQMRDVIRRLVERIRVRQRFEALKIMEIGAGTGGTTHILAPFLASLDIPVEYTFTDLSASMVANARRNFGKEYPFMRFVVHDIEKPPADELKNQHIVIASNAIHATHSLIVSSRNVRSALRPDGFLMMLEMTEIVPFIDIIFGLLDGWWLFDDGRRHAIVPAEHWERDLHAAGFGHVDWTDGTAPENNFQKVIIALASGSVQDRLPKPTPTLNHDAMTQLARDRASQGDMAERYVAKYTAGWATTMLSSTVGEEDIKKDQPDSSDAVVIVTGATGSLGSHLVAALVEHAHVKNVVCINRRSSSSADTRQAYAFSSRGIELSASMRSKLRVLEADTSKPQLGLQAAEYAWLVQNGTHIVHNAWPMSGTRPIHAFES